MSLIWEENKLALSVPSGGKTSQLSHGASEGARADGAASGAAPNFDPWTLAHIRVFGIPPIQAPPTGKPSIFILSERKPLLKSKRGN